MPFVAEWLWWLFWWWWLAECSCWWAPFGVCAGEFGLREPLRRVFGESAPAPFRIDVGVGVETSEEFLEALPCERELAEDLCWPLWWLELLLLLWWW